MEKQTPNTWPALAELAPMYQETAQVLAERIKLLRAQPPDPGNRHVLARRLAMLEAMRREARELSVLTARYYERGYFRNAKYTV